MMTSRHGNFLSALQAHLCDGNHRLLVDSPQKGPVMRILMGSCVGSYKLLNNRMTEDFRLHDIHMTSLVKMVVPFFCLGWLSWYNFPTAKTILLIFYLFEMVSR